MYFFKTVSWSARGFTLVRCSFPPEPLVQMIRCLEKRKHCFSPSFFRDREPSRPRVILPFSLMGTCIRDPEKTCMRVQDALALQVKLGNAEQTNTIPAHGEILDWHMFLSDSYQFPHVFVSCSASVAFPISGSTSGLTGKNVITLGNERIGLVFEHTVLYGD